jgi:hypothetical protein
MKILFTIMMLSACEKPEHIIMPPPIVGDIKPVEDKVQTLQRKTTELRELVDDLLLKVEEKND